MTEPPADAGMTMWKRIKRHRNVIVFWFLGLANNYGYVVMLTAAHDILAEFDSDDHQAGNSTSYARECNTMSTGIILLADIIPSIFIKIISPFIPLCIFVRMAFTVGFSIAGFILVGVRLQKWMVILGVLCTSLSSGLGESSILSYSVFFKTTNVISTWSSGTGGAGIVGAVSYTALTALGLQPVTTILVMLVVPVVQGILFFFCLDHPQINSIVYGVQKDSELSIPVESDALSFRNKLKIIPHLLVTYMLPFGLVYLFEYFINQGLFELLYFPNSYLSHAEQYRWYSVLYQVGVFVSRSSMNLITINYLWLISLFQLINMVLCIFEVFYGFVTYLPILMVIIFWEGVVGGASYVNTYRRIATEMAPEARQYSMAMNAFADSFMITIAGVLSTPVHNMICAYPSPYK